LGKHGTAIVFPDTKVMAMTYPHKGVFMSIRDEQTLENIITASLDKILNSSLSSLIVQACEDAIEEHNIQK